jgi:hypothetical protein
MPDASVSTAVISAVAGIAVASGIALVKGAIASRSRENEELRDWRLKSYPAVWKLTSAVPRWPHSNPTYRDLWSLHYQLRDWYYQTGGLYLSENARARYGSVQGLLDIYLVNRPRDDQTLLPQGTGDSKDSSAYEALMESLSAFRTALTEDLATRRSRSIVWSVALWWRHFQAGRRAKMRLEAARDHVRRADLAEAPDMRVVPTPERTEVAAASVAHPSG